ncbi:chemotaxis protein CheW [Tenuibacillus multivorans]|uniref:Chemotaxis protein CheW n=1 Tax=Tenuibacillus multivorans TaxID=237069 RepID=A0A1G9XX47_9BACI|nr:chemotaxis protein CheW [Tenuibacillus multivorans]GEL75856.1 chemotaxis protein CheW [Tenuibacillus multivorans]SDN01422.1 purine-binding chemotaxis protein CheW [Tenuibacillus multivorans]
MLETTSNQSKMIVFQLKDEYYGVPVDTVGSIERVQQITRVPNTQSFIKGVINLRGVVTPIIDLRERFQMDAAEFTDQTRIIIVHFDGKDVGLIVDSAKDVVDLPEDSIEPPPEVIGSVEVDYIRGVAKDNNRLLILLNLEKVLSMDEKESLSTVD